MNNTILVAEDDDQFRKLMVRFVEGTYTVLEAENGEDAYTLAQTKKPDVIFTDILMPKMTGTELIRKLKENESTKNIPVIVLLATAYPSDIVAAQSLNVADILPKEDITRQILIEKIKKFAA
jgi:CheY-like chemotaxis protein